MRCQPARGASLLVRVLGWVHSLLSWALANVSPVDLCSERESVLTQQSTHLDRMTRPVRDA